MITISGWALRIFFKNRGDTHYEGTSRGLIEDTPRVCSPLVWWCRSARRLISRQFQQDGIGIRGFRDRVQA
jgi:hypothetical protein